MKDGLSMWAACVCIARSIERTRRVGRPIGTQRPARALGFDHCARVRREIDATLLRCAAPVVGAVALEEWPMAWVGQDADFGRDCGVRVCVSVYVCHGVGEWATRLGFATFALSRPARPTEMSSIALPSKPCVLSP